MKKRLSIIFVLCIVLVFVILLIQIASAAISIDKIDVKNAVISELNDSALFKFNLNNDGGTDNCEIFSFVDVSIKPKGSFSVPHGNSSIDVEVTPGSESRRKITGFFAPEYIFHCTNSGTQQGFFTIKIVPVSQVFDYRAGDLKLDDKNAVLWIRNVQNLELNNVDISVSSDLYKGSVKKSFVPFQQFNLTFPFNSEDVLGKRAGNYNVDIAISVNGLDSQLRDSFLYYEKAAVKEEKDGSGFIIRNVTLIRRNVGNVDADVNISSSKNILTRLFTTYNPNPKSTERHGLFITYNWEARVLPGESFHVTARTNYTLPIILILIIILVAVATKFFTRTPMTVTKNVHFIRAKGAEWAIKVTIHAKARKDLREVMVSDTLPSHVKLYEKFAKAPDTIDHNLRGVHWNVGHLAAGEERIFSYIIYSNVKVIGGFGLPLARASFLIGDERQTIFSNKAYFVASQTSVEEE